MEYKEFKNKLSEKVILVAVSKTKPKSDILDLYNQGQKIFGENKVQELLSKYNELPKDIEWHLIGHLQTNKVKQIIDKVKLIQSVDSEKLITKINEEAKKQSLKVNILLQMKIANEETKYGLNETELEDIISKYNENDFPNITIKGLMGMATFTDDELLISDEFRYLENLFNKYKSLVSSFEFLSMGMSSDYQIAIQNGSNMIRIGSLLFGNRNYN